MYDYIYLLRAWFNLFHGVQMPEKSLFDKSKRILNHSELMVVDKHATRSNEIAK